MIILGPVPCKGCQQSVYWGTSSRTRGSVNGWRDAADQLPHLCPVEPVWREKLLTKLPASSASGAPPASG